MSYQSVNNQINMNKKLLVASSYHHVLVAIAKSCEETNSSRYDLLISNSWTDDDYWSRCLTVLNKEKWFDRVFYYDEKSNRPPSPMHIIKTIKYEHVVEPQKLKAMNLDLTSYQMIYVVHDNMFPGATIVKLKVPYTYIEDTSSVFSNGSSTPPSRLMKLSRNAILAVFALSRTFHYWHPIYGYSSNCQAIEVSDINVNWPLPEKKLKLVNRKALLQSIPEDIKLKILNMFIDKNSLCSLMSMQSIKTLLVITCPIKQNISSEEMINICEWLIDNNNNGIESVIIKPHPRDLTDYSKFMSAGLVLPRNFPLEVFDYLGAIEFTKAVTVGSTALNSIECYQDCQYYTYGQYCETTESDTKKLGN